MDLNDAVVPVRPAGGMWTSVHSLSRHVMMDLPGQSSFEPVLLRFRSIRAKSATVFMATLSRLSTTVGRRSMRQDRVFT